MSAVEHRKPPEDFDESPEWTEADFAAATRGPRWSRQRAADALREGARALRKQAEMMDAQAEALVGSDSR